MSRNRKTKSGFILSIVLIVAIFTFFLSKNLKKDSKYYAEQFLEVFTTPEDGELAKYYHPMFDSETKTATESERDFNNYIASIDKEYRDLMTNKGFEEAMSNRFIPWEILIKEDSNYSIKIDSIDVKKMSDYDDGRVHYIYIISLIISFADGKNETVQVSGDIVMIEENGSWLVDIFRWNSDYQHIYKLLSI